MTTSTAVSPMRASAYASLSPIRSWRIALLGVGRVGGAVAELVRDRGPSLAFSVASGLVRDTRRERPQAKDVPLTSNASEALAGQPDLVIEALGGVEPARTIVLDALDRGIPVVTANKSLLAAHGDILLDAASRAGVPFRYEAAVLAGVPFLGAFTRRPLARALTGFAGIVNGTTNFVLSRMADEGVSLADALADAQSRGYAEPDPDSDLSGVDAVEKLCVLARHFGDWSIRPADVERTGITGIGSHDIRAAAEFGGCLKPVVVADWHTGELSAFAGPAFVPAGHPLARVNGVVNAVALENRLSGELFLAGPGAGPVVTAATLLDDASEIAAEGVGGPGFCDWRHARPSAPVTAWFVRISAGPRAQCGLDESGSERLPEDTAIADLLSAHDVWLHRTSDHCGNRSNRWFLTHPCSHLRLAEALRTLEHAAGCHAFCARALEA
jgi:homoserine dehydrogenase